MRTDLDRSATAVTLAVALTLPLTSCATIVTGSEDSVKILSNPPGAAFTTNAGASGVTPAAITIPDDLTLEVSYSLAGYRDQKALLEPRMSAWIFGNILIGGLIGLAVDLVTGQWRTHAGELSVTLVPVGDAPAPDAPEPR